MRNDSEQTEKGVAADAETQTRHRRLALSLAGLVVGMVGLSYAAVPLYEIFCRVTGYGGTTQRAEKPADRILEQRIAVRFDANKARGLGWDFAPVTRELDLRIGESALAFYKASNPSAVTTRGTATFNVTPEAAGPYFNKIACFCFVEQELASKQSVDMPVTFFIDPAIVDDPETQHITEITLSYTFFPVEPDPEEVAATGKAESTGTGS